MLVEDDDFFRGALKDCLSSKGYTVLEAQNGQIAKNIIKATPCDLILSDVQMPFLNGIELLEWLRTDHATPFILMTGFTNLIETQKAYDLGANEFLSKPFRNEELITAIEKLLQPIGADTPAVHDDDDESDYRKASIEEFVARPTIDFDVFVRLSDKKFVKIGYKGDTLPLDRIRSYRDKGVQYLYLKAEDFPKLVQFNLELSQIIQKNTKISPEKKANFMKYTGELILEQAFMEGVSKECFNEASAFLKSSVQTVTELGDSFELLGALNVHSDFIYAHSLGVSMYALMIARKMGITSSQIFFKLSMAGLFHDIGKKEIPREILGKPRPLLSQQERKLIETHPSRSKEILMAMDQIPSDIVQICFEHHEDCLGQGFPRGLSKNQIHPLAKILYVADLFINQALKTPNHKGMSPAKAIEMMELKKDLMDPKAFEGLKGIFSQSKKKAA